MAQSWKFPSIVNVNVGGQWYTSSLATLTRFPDTRLGKMFSGGSDLVSQDDKGNFFIDRDGTMFVHVLHFLRTSKLSLPGNFQEHEKLKDEAEFYEIPGLVGKVTLDRQIKMTIKTNEEILVITGVTGNLGMFTRYPRVYGLISTLQEIFPDVQEVCKITTYSNLRRQTNDLHVRAFNNFLNREVGEAGFIEAVPGSSDRRSYLNNGKCEIQIVNLPGKHGFSLVSTTGTGSGDGCASLIFSRTVHGK